MINQTLPTNISIHQLTPIGVRLKSAREALGMDRKDVAAQLRLPEKVIVMIESGEFKTDLPLTFIRGYIRNYSKLMGIPDKELSEAMEFLKPKSDIAESEQTSLPATGHVTASGPCSTTKQFVNFSNYFMQLFTCLLAITLIGLVGIWWHTHKSNSHTNDSLPDVSIQVVPGDKVSQETATQPGIVNPKESKNPAVTAMNADSTSSNAENPDSQTPPNAIDAVTNTAQTPAGTNTSPDTGNLSASSDQQSATLVIKADKALLAYVVTGDRPIHWLASFILFLIIITASMRIYNTQPLSPVMAGTRNFFPNIDFGSMLKLASQFKINKTLRLTILFVIVISLMGFGLAKWYRDAKTQSIHTDEKPLAVTPPKQEAELNLPLNASLETLAPSSNLNAVLMANYRTFVLQPLVNQLDNYVSQAAATTFALTDKSTPIGQFTPYKYKKKPRIRHHRIYNNNGNATYYNNNYGNSAPPYYYQAYGVSGQ